MLRFIIEYKEGKILLKDYMVDGWSIRKIEKVSFSIRYEPKVSDIYKEWLKKNLAKILTPGLNVPTGIINIESEH